MLLFNRSVLSLSGQRRGGASGAPRSCRSPRVSFLLDAQHAAGVGGAGGTHDVALGDDHQIAGDQEPFVAQQVDGVVGCGHAVVIAVKVNRGDAAVQGGQIERALVA